MLVDYFNRATIQCIYFLEKSEIPKASELSAVGLHVAEMSGKNVRTEEDLFSAIAQALDFPNYFGRNWDALDECLRDLAAWIPAKGYVLIIRDALPLWHHATKVAGMLVQSWLFCDEEWLKENVPFHLIFEIA